MSRVLQIFSPSKIDFRSARALFLMIRNDFSCGAGSRVRQVFWSRVTLSQRIVVTADRCHRGSWSQPEFGAAWRDCSPCIWRLSSEPFVRDSLDCCRLHEPRSAMIRNRTDGPFLGIFLSVIVTWRLSLGIPHIVFRRGNQSEVCGFLGWILRL